MVVIKKIALIDKIGAFKVAENRSLYLRDIFMGRPLIFMHRGDRKNWLNIAINRSNHPMGLFSITGGFEASQFGETGLLQHNEFEVKDEILKGDSSKYEMNILYVYSDENQIKGDIELYNKAGWTNYIEFSEDSRLWILKDKSENLSFAEVLRFDEHQFLYGGSYYEYLTELVIEFLSRE